MAFAAALAAGVGAEWTSGALSAGLWAGAALSAVAFVALVLRHRRVRASEEWNGTLAELNREALARLERDWAGIPEPAEAAGPPPTGHPYASDLDLFGPASLRALLSTVATAPGAALLRDWLLGAADPRGGAERGPAGYGAGGSADGGAGSDGDGRERGPPSADEVRARQRAVRALAPRLDLRDALAAHGRLSGTVEPASVDRFLAWAEARSWLADRPLLRWGAWILPALTWGLGLAQMAGAVERVWWGLPLLATLYLAGRVRPAVHGLFERASAGEAELHRWASSVELLAGLEGDPELGGLAEPFTAGERDAPASLRRLDRQVHLADARHGLMHFFLQALLFWDVHVLRSLERWKRRSGHRVRAWIEGLARADALAALAALSHDHPDWCFPELVAPGAGRRGRAPGGEGREGSPEGADVAPGREPGRAAARRDHPARTLEAEELGHPLLAPEACVRNDVEVGPPGTFLLVTGSNMSGKSTLLRSVGVAAVLGWAGGPVCARRMRLPPLGVHTSIRVEDSLVRGVSQYMAELERVRQIVDSARRLSGRGDGARTVGTAGWELGDGAVRPSHADGSADTAPPRRLLYLMDEPLRGTNEAERREAVRIILRRLLDLGAVGAVATHDLVLHRSEGLEEAARPVHFRGEVEGEGEGPALSFDYRLREGPATSTNALDLLRLAGLGPEGPEEGRPGPETRDDG